MAAPMLLDDSLFRRVERLQKEIKEEAEEKLNSKLKVKKNQEKIVVIYSYS